MVSIKGIFLDVNDIHFILGAYTCMSSNSYQTICNYNLGNEPVCCTLLHHAAVISETVIAKTHNVV